MARIYGHAYSQYGQIVHGVETVTLSDTVSYEGVNGFMVDADGTLAVTMVDDSSAALVVKAGITYPFAIKIAKSTGSSSITNVVLLY